MKEMHQIVHEGLEDVLDQLFEADRGPRQENRVKNKTVHHTSNGVEGKTFMPLKF